MTAPSPLLFKYPAQCGNSAPTQMQGRIALPAVKANAATSLLPAVPKLPALPQQFTMTLEAKLQQPGKEEAVSTIVWAVDVPARQERIDIYSLLYAIR